MSPRPKNPPPDRRQTILEAALRLFAEKGYNATTNADIAREAGITAAALYYYFSSKEELFRAVVSERWTHLTPTLTQLGGEEALAVPPRELIPVVLRNVMTFLSDERTQRVLKIILAEGNRAPAIMEIWLEQVAAVVLQVFPYLQHQMAHGNIRPMDPRLVFLILQGPIMATVLIRDLLRSPFLQEITNESLVESLIQTTLAALLTDGHKEG